MNFSFKVDFKISTAHMSSDVLYAVGTEVQGEIQVEGINFGAIST